jgi:hypothetical protein
MGDTSSDNLKLSRERARGTASGVAPVNAAIKRKRKIESSIRLKDGSRENSSGATSRVLDEKTQSWMKKTTYLVNNIHQKAHNYTSLAETNERKVAKIEKVRWLEIEREASALLDVLLLHFLEMIWRINILSFVS